MKYRLNFYVKSLLGLVLVVSWISARDVLSESQGAYKRVYNSINTDYLSSLEMKKDRSYNILEESFDVMNLSKGYEYKLIEYKRLRSLFSKLEFQIDKLTRELNGKNTTTYPQKLSELPKDYNQTKKVKEIFETEGEAQKIINLLDSALIYITQNDEELFLATSEAKAVKDYLERKNQILSQSNFFKEISTESDFLDLITNYDITHAIGFLRVLKKELYIIKTDILINLSRLFMELPAIDGTRPHLLYIADYRNLKVGQKTKLRFMPLNYITLPSDAKVMIDGQPIEVKDGIGHFSFTPTTKGTKSFDLDVTFYNFFTGKMDTFSSKEQIEVY